MNHPFSTSVNFRWLGFAAMLLLVAVVFAQKQPEALLRSANELQNKGILLEATDKYQAYLRLVPSDYEVRWTLVELLVKVKRLDEARIHLDYLIVHTPKDPRLKEYAYLRHGKKVAPKVVYDPAVAGEFETRIQSGKIEPEELLEYGHYLTSTNKLSRAAEVFRLYLKRKPTDRAAGIDLARIYSWTKQYGAGRAQCQQLLKADPNDSEVLSVLGDIEHWSGNDKNAIAVYRRALVYATNPATIQGKINQVLATPGMREIDMYARARKDHTGKTGLLLAKQFYEQGRDSEADSLVRVRLAFTALDTAALKLDSLLKIRSARRATEELTRLRERYQRNANDTTAIIGLAQNMNQYADSGTVAVKYYEKYLKLKPDDYDAKTDYAHALIWLGRYEDAEDILRRLEKAYPDSEEVQLALADALLHSLRDAVHAERIYRKAIPKHPEDINLQIGLGESLRMQGRYDEAREVYNRVLESDSTNKWVQYMLSYMEEEYGPLIHAAESRLQTNPDDMDALEDLAKYLLKSKLYLDAEKAYRRLQNMMPGDSSFAITLKELERRKLGWQFNEFHNTLKRIEENPDNFEARLQLANFLSGVGKYKEAIEQYKIALTLKPNDPQLMAALANLYIFDRQFTEALEFYQALIERYPKEYDYNYRYAETLGQLNDNRATLMAYEKASTLRPDAIECLLNVAEMHQEVGEEDRAVDTYQKILQIDPDCIPALNALSEMKGTFIRNTEFNREQTMNSDGFVQYENTATIGFGLSIQNHYRIGYGELQLEQNKMKEIGRYLLAESEIRLMKYLWNNFSVRYYQWQNRNFTSVQTDFTYTFDQLQWLTSLKGMAYGSAQDGFLEVGSLDSLSALHNELSAYTGGFHFTAVKERFTLDGDYSYTDLSDLNHRDRAWGEFGYHPNNHITIGVRREMVRFIKPSTRYWATRQYDVIGGYLALEGKSNSLDYSFKLIDGSVMTTKSMELDIDAQLNYQFKKILSAGIGFSSMKTRHETGSYRSQTVTGTLTATWQ